MNKIDNDDTKITKQVNRRIFINYANLFFMLFMLFIIFICIIFNKDVEHALDWLYNFIIGK